MRCYVCGVEMKTIVLHHRCYNPEIVIDVCKHCHYEIHKGNSLIYLDPTRVYREAMFRVENYKCLGETDAVFWLNTLVPRDELKLIFETLALNYPKWNLCGLPPRKVKE